MAGRRGRPRARFRHRCDLPTRNSLPHPCALVQSLRENGCIDCLQAAIGCAVASGAVLSVAERTALFVAADGYVLHAVPANGGGVDRHVRDICTQRNNDCILHIARAQCVLEVVAARRLLAVDYADMPPALASGAFGQPALLHAHSTLAPVRDRVRQLCRALAIGYVVTLHDIDFAAAALDVGDGEREARLAFVSEASARIAPSPFMLNVLLAALGSSVTAQLIENGVKPGATVAAPFPAAGSSGEQPFQVAVIGALGPHKGLVFLRDVVAALPESVRVVILGYADGQVTPGWLQTDRLWVHGAFEPAELATIVRRYGVTLAFFPNRQPESYCYALSDGWCAGLPALGPAFGAIGDRIAATGAGWTFERDSTARGVAERLMASLRVAGQKNAAVRRAVEQLRTPALMVEQLGHVYEKNMKTAHTPPDISALESVAATHLNGSFFRGELLRLSGDIAFAQTQAEQTAAALQSLTHEFDGRGKWITTLEKSLADVQAELRRVEAARQAERVATTAAREEDRSHHAAARDQERVAAETARSHERAAAETARSHERTAAEAALRLALHDAAAAHASDRAAIEAAREKERTDAATARARDVAEFATTLAQIRAEIDDARHSERALAQALREQADAAHAREIAALHALHDAAARERSLREQALAEATLAASHAAHVKNAEKLQRDVNDTLTIAHRYEKTIAQYDRALWALPSILRRWALKRAHR